MRKKKAALILLPLLVCLAAICRAEDNRAIARYGESSGMSSSLVGGGIQDRNGLLWFATWNGLNCYDGYDFHWVKINPGDGASIATNHIRDILLAENGNIICHTDDDIFEFDLDTYTFKSLPPNRKDALIDKVGQNWEGLTDTQGNQWTADRSGLYKTHSPHHPATLLKGTEGEHPRSILVDKDNNLWVGTSRHPGIKVFSPEGTIIEEISLDAPPYCIFQSSNGDVWVGGKPGFLKRLDGDLISRDVVYDIAEDRHGRLWIATFGEGIKCCPNHADDSPSLSSSLGGKRVRKLLITPSDNLVAATNDGLLIGHINNDYAKTELRPIRRDGNNPSSLSNDVVMSLTQDSEGNIYIATESSGIELISEESLFSANPKFRHFNVANGTLRSDVCNAIAMDGDTLLMIAGNDNVTAFNPKDAHNVNFSTAFWGDTCRFSETAPVKLADGTWIFGAEQGAFIATRHNLYSRGFIPPIVFTTISVNGEPETFTLVPRDSISLSRDERNVTIRFAAIDYIDNRDIVYRTRLDNSPWTAATRSRSATLFNLAPGTHKLEVQSTDRYGRYVDNNRLLTIKVAPYWYETNWAKILFVIIAIGLIAGVIYTFLYIRRVNRQRKELLDKYMAAIGNAADGEMSTIVNATTTQSEMPRIEQAPEVTAFLNRVLRYIEENLNNPDANVDEMALAAAASRSTLNRRLRSHLGISAAQLLIEARMRKAEQLLRECPDERFSLPQIALECGYSDIQYFQRVFKKKHSLSPADFRARHKKASTQQVCAH